MKKCTAERRCLFPHTHVLPGIFMVLIVAFSFNADCAEEMYIITTRSGAEIIVKDYTLSDERVEFTTGSDQPGFIKRGDFVKISNMVGVPPKAPVPAETLDSRKEKESFVWIVSAAVLFVLYAFFHLYVIRKKQRDGQEDADIYYGRVEMEPVTQGHLAFQYCGPFGRKSTWIIEVRSAYEEDGILFVEGISTETGKRKIFQADLVEGPVTDLSNGRKAGIDAFFCRS